MANIREALLFFGGVALTEPGDIADRGLLWLAPYVGTADGTIDGPTTVYHCPSKHIEPLMQGLSGPIPDDMVIEGLPDFMRGLKVRPYGYGYNGLGTLQRPPAAVSLGLGPVVSEGAIVRTSASRVRFPSEMIGIGDSVGRYLGYIHPYTSLAHAARFDSVGSIHRHGANMVFCDGHVEYGKKTELTAPSSEVRRRWNNDNEPHAETW